MLSNVKKKNQFRCFCFDVKMLSSLNKSCQCLQAVVASSSWFSSAVFQSSLPLPTLLPPTSFRWEKEAGCFWDPLKLCDHVKSVVRRRTGRRMSEIKSHGREFSQGTNLGGVYREWPPKRGVVGDLYHRSVTEEKNNNKKNRHDRVMQIMSIWIGETIDEELRWTWRSTSEVNKIKINKHCKNLH